MSDSVSRALIALVLSQLLFAILLPIVLIPPPDGLEFRLYAIGFTSARDLVIESAAATVLLFTLVVAVLWRARLTGVVPVTVFVGLALVAAPFWQNTAGLRELYSKGPLFFAGYAGIALLLGVGFWLLAVRGSRDY